MSDQSAAGEFLQQSHEDVSILDVLEQVVDLDGRVTLRREEGRKEVRNNGGSVSIR